MMLLRARAGGAPAWHAQGLGLQGLGVFLTRVARGQGHDAAPRASWWSACLACAGAPGSGVLWNQGVPVQSYSFNLDFFG